MNIHLNRTKLIEALKLGLVYAAPNDDVRPALERVNFVKQGEVLHVIGADGYRMSVSVVPTLTELVNFSSFGIDVGDVKTLIPYLTKLDSEFVEFEITDDVIQVEQTTRILRHYGYEVETKIVDLPIHRIRIETLNYTSNVFKAPDYFSVLTAYTSNKVASDKVSNVFKRYQPEFSNQRRQRISAVKELANTPNLNTKWNREDTTKYYVITEINLLDQSSYFESVYIHDLLKSLPQCEIANFNFVTSKYDTETTKSPLLVNCSNHTIIIMPRNPNHAGYTPGSMHNIALNL